jgi:hypothetical protein
MNAEKFATADKSSCQCCSTKKTQMTELHGEKHVINFYHINFTVDDKKMAQEQTTEPKMSSFQSFASTSCNSNTNNQSMMDLFESISKSYNANQITNNASNPNPAPKNSTPKPMLKVETAMPFEKKAPVRAYEPSITHKPLYANKIKNNAKPSNYEGICRELKANLNDHRLQKQVDSKPQISLPIESSVKVNTYNDNLLINNNHADNHFSDLLYRDFNETEFNDQFKRNFCAPEMDNNIFNLQSNNLNDFLSNSSAESFDENRFFEL